MSTKSIEQFFTGKSFTIPGYQRDYAWGIPQVEELFGDLEEAMDVGGSHYIGTFIIAQKDKATIAQIVDGQQRLTTITLMLDALICALSNLEVQRYYHATFIEHPVTGPKFTVLGNNEKFFRRLLSGERQTAETDGQLRLIAAHGWIKDRVQAISQRGGQDLIQKFLVCISGLEVLEFIEHDEGKAIRMFQSVNDRGVPLSKIDIVKSLLIYYSNRFLSGKLDQHIAEKFGTAFHNFSCLKRLARESGFKIRHIARDAFCEDDILRYHYLAFDGTDLGIGEGVDYYASTDTVVNNFLKSNLARLKHKVDELENFILTYSNDLAAFFEGLQTLVSSTRTDRELYLLFITQDLSATLYPLVIRLQLQGSLREKLINHANRSLLDVVKVTDLRVFKVRGTNPQADIAILTRQLRKITISEVAAGLLRFCERFMPDALFEARLAEEDIYQNAGIVRLLLEYELRQNDNFGDCENSLDVLSAITKEGLTVEHVLSQTPSFEVHRYGFIDYDDYARHLNRLGNLVLLEASLNTACNNLAVEQKMRGERLYRASKFRMVKQLAAHHAGNEIGFTREAVIERGRALASMAVMAWPINSDPCPTQSPTAN